MAAASAWASLDGILVDRVLERLPCVAHRSAFAAVCKTWRAVEAQHPPPLPPQLPWIFLPSAGAHDPSFFCVLCGAAHRAFLPDDVRAARCCGSFPGGWLALALPQAAGGGHALHNLHTGERNVIPDFLRTADGVGENGLIVSAAVLAPGDCLAAVLAKCASTIAFCVPGTSLLFPPKPAALHPRASWRDMLPRHGIADAIFYFGHRVGGFHVLTDNEEVLVYVPDLGPDGQTGLVTYRFPGHEVTTVPLGHTGSRYLLDFFGELVMVVRFVSTMENDEGTRLFHAFRLRTTAVQAGHHGGHRQAYWDRVFFPANVVVILGRGSSMALSSRGIAFDGIYFLDDATSFGDVMAALEEGRPFPCTDMGRCTLHQDQEPEVQLVFPIRPPSECSPAVWFFHSDPADAQDIV